MVRGKAVEVAQNLEILEEIEPLDGAKVLEQTQLLGHDHLFRADRLTVLRDLVTAPHRDQQQDASEACRERQRHRTPPPDAASAPPVELLAQLGAIAGPVHRGRLSNRAGDIIVEELAEHLGVLPAVRTLLEMPGDALALGGRKLAAQIRDQFAVRMPRHVSASPRSSSGSRARGAGGRARSPPST